MRNDNKHVSVVFSAKDDGLWNVLTDDWSSPYGKITPKYMNPYSMASLKNKVNNITSCVVCECKI